MAATTITNANKDDNPPHHPPLELSPLVFVPPARRIQRRSSQGLLHRMLERVVPTITNAASSPPSSRPDITSSSLTTMSTSTSSCYAIHHVLHEHPHTKTQVLLATAASTGAMVAIKAVPRPRASSSRITTTTTTAACSPCHGGDDPWREIAALQHLQPSSHIIPLLDYLQDQDYVYLIMPYLPDGDLFSRVKATGGQGLPDAEAAHYLRQIAQGLLFMKHHCNIAHHDVSLENIMLTTTATTTTTSDKQEHPLTDVQIIDLGMCLRVPITTSIAGVTNMSYVSPQPCRGKPGYVSPEVFREEAYDPFASDVWSLGVCLYAMLTATPLYPSPRDQAFHHLSRLGGVEVVVDCYESYGVTALSSSARDLVCRMLHAHPTSRPTLEDVLSHPFLTTH